MKMFSPMAVMSGKDGSITVSPWSLPATVRGAFPVPHPVTLQEQYNAYKRLALAQIQPPRNPSKPLTSFFIKDILPSDDNDDSKNNNKESSKVNRSRDDRGCTSPPSIVRPWDSHRGSPTGSNASCSAGDSDDDVEVDIVDEIRPELLNSSPLDALLQMTNKTFEGLNDDGTHDESRKDHLTIFSKNQPPKKRRKSRTAFTNQQIYELEKRFLYQKYLTPADRDEIAHQLGLSNAQVITWFQNRRAKLKRDLEELKADVNAAKTLTGVNGDSFGNLEELQFFQRYGLKKQDKKESS